MSSNDPNRPSMFSCARQVSMLQVGTEDLTVTNHTSHTANQSGFDLKNHYLQRSHLSQKSDKSTVPKPVLKNISEGLSFTDEVVREMAPYTIPYSESTIYDAFDTTEFLSKAETKMKIPGGRFNMHGADRRHMSCHFKKLVPYKLKPIKRAIMKRAMEMHKQAMEAEQCTTQDREKFLGNKSSSPDSDEEPESSIFLTQTSERRQKLLSPRSKHVKPTKSKNQKSQRADPAAKITEAEPLARKEEQITQVEEKHQWDEYLLSVLTGPTAQWIVTQRTDVCGDRFKTLHKIMVDKHGEPKSTELVRDSIAEYDPPQNAGHPPITIRDRPNTRSARLLDPARRVAMGKKESSDEDEDLDTVPYADKNKASFYRLPGGIKKKVKAQQKEMGALNATATSIVVNSLQLPPPPKIRDFVDPRITENTVYETSNNFQRDWLTGNRQVHQSFTDGTEIVMENHNKYNKVLQDAYPRTSDEWAPSEFRNTEAKIHKIRKGLHRWKDLPQPVEDSSQMMAGVVDDLERQVTDSSADKFQPSEALSKIVDEWRSKWHLNMRFDDSSPEQLIKDMSDMHPHVRIKAISTCARAVCYKPPPLVGIQLTATQTPRRFQRLMNPADKGKLPEEIYVGLECLLEDEHPKVKLAAAITLHALSRPNEVAEQILRANLQPDMNKADRWAAVQCLGIYGETDSQVIGECITQMLSTEDMIKYEKACSLLALISHNTTEDLDLNDSLVHSMLAEHLNDVSWRHRVMSLKCLPKLYGELNIDIQNKLVHLMWNDTHSDVRRTAAQSLGKCGYGRLVHDKMKEKLLEGNQTERTETLTKIGYLGLMTAKLMLPFMKAFRDEYVAVRREACIAAGNLGIQDDNLIAELIRLSTRDPIWRIKALAIQALGKIGLKTPDIKEVLLWALRFEEEEGVRAEACHSIVLLQLKDKEVLDILQNRMLVEESPIVQAELVVAMELNGVSASEDMAMVAQIKAEVRKLSNRTDIFNSICVLERELELKDNTERMIYLPPQPKTPKMADEQKSVEAAREEVDEELPYPRPAKHPEITIIEEEPEEVDKSRPASSRRSSAKSRPSTGHESLDTETLEAELEEMMIENEPLAGEPVEGADESLTPGTTATPCSKKATPISDRSSRFCSRPVTGLEKAAFAAESNRTSVTPTALSTTIDQTEGYHSNKRSVVDKMRRSAAAKTPVSDKNETIGSLLKKGTSEKSTLGNEVEQTRLESTRFLFDRYVDIDIKTPDTFSECTSVIEDPAE